MKKNLFHLCEIYLILITILTLSQTKNLKAVLKDNIPSSFPNNIINNSKKLIYDSNLNTSNPKQLPFFQQSNQNEKIKNFSQNGNDQTFVMTSARLLQIKTLTNKTSSNSTNTKNTTKPISKNTQQDLQYQDRLFFSDFPLLPPVIGDVLDTTLGIGGSIVGTVVDAATSVVQTAVNTTLGIGGALGGVFGTVATEVKKWESFITNTSYVCENIPADRNVPGFINPPLAPIKMPYDKYVTKYKAESVDARDPYRQAIYKNNLNMINSHNQLTTRSYDMGLNLFTDLEDTQFNAQYFGLMIPPEILNNVTPYEGAVQPRKIRIDWQCKSGSVLIQGQCGSCYALAALDSIQITRRIYNQQATVFSSQQILSCANNGNDLNGCKGGFFKAVFDYVQFNGIGPENTYHASIEMKNSGIPPACDTSIYKTTKYDNTKFKIRTSVMITYGDCYTLVETLRQRAIAVAIAADQLRFYVKGTFTTDKTTLNHGVTLVGYDANRKYKIKNSWTAGWGIDGYGFVDNSTGICNFATYPQLIVQSKTPKSCC